MGRSTSTQLRQRESELSRQKSFLQAQTRDIVAKQSVEINFAELLDPWKSSFVRSPEGFVSKLKSSDPARRLRELARHVFALYPVPPVLAHVWDSLAPSAPGARLDLARRRRGGAPAAPVARSGIDFRDWHVCVATGGSLHKAHAKAFLTKQETHTFLNCRHELNCEQALRFAVAVRAGASDGIALRLARSKLSEMPFDEHWRGFVRFLAAHPPASVQQCSDLCDYLAAMRRERPEFTLFGQGLTIASLLRRMDDWHRDLRRIKALGDAQWSGHAIEDCSFERKDEQGHAVYWDFRQILNTKDLAAEGNAQRHCVFSYKSLCVSGEASIWSLCKRDRFGQSDRKLTIELRSDGRIAQARGLANRMPRSEEMAILRLWAQKNQLDLRDSGL